MARAASRSRCRTVDRAPIRARARTEKHHSDQRRCDQHLLSSATTTRERAFHTQQAVPAYDNRATVLQTSQTSRPHRPAAAGTKTICRMHNTPGSVVLRYYASASRIALTAPQGGFVVCLIANTRWSGIMQVACDNASARPVRVRVRFRLPPPRRWR